MALTKPGIVRLVVVTSAVGFVLGAMVAGGGTIGAFLWTGVWCLLGTAFAAAGANALNQAMEHRRDARMARTRARPVPAGRMTVHAAVAAGTVLSAAGVAVLLVGTNAVASSAALATIVLYVFVYTPLKPITPLALWIGAVPGALPPMIGWTAAFTGGWRGLDHPGGWSLFLIMFAWQVPHFLALAWKYRDDYARGGFRVLTIGDRAGLATGWQSILWTLIMVGLSLVPMWAMHGHVGWLYGFAAVMLGSFMLWLSVGLLAERSDESARRLFLGSIAYLPLVLAAMVGDAVINMVG